MKRYGNLWESVVRWENLLLAAKKAKRGKGDRLVVQRFNFDLESQLLRFRVCLLHFRFFCPELYGSRIARVWR